jgi:putative tryptophan/tyrosine transport system substrate-binding protein
VRRREFITLLGGGGVAAAWAHAAPAQQASLPVIGYLSALGKNDRPKLADGFRRGLSDAGYVDGRNVTIEYRFAENQSDRLPAFAADLVGRKVAVIAATGGDTAVLAAKAVTNEIPIVFTYGGDPVRRGLVRSINRPDGNVTGISFFSASISAKGLGLLHDLVPNVAVVAFLINLAEPEAAHTLSDAQAAASSLGERLLVLNASVPSEIDAAFASLRQQGAGALVVGGSPFYTARHQQIVALAAQVGIPTMYFSREFIPDGGLISYGNDIPDAYRQAALYVARMLKGEKPADLPVIQSVKFELVINMKTARTLGLTIPSGVLAIADEVIE